MNYIVDVEVECPYCGELFPITVDTSQGPHTMIEDCTICCRPISIILECEPGEVTGTDISRP